MPYLRQRIYLRQRYRALTGYLGVFLMIIGVSFFGPLLILPFYPEDTMYASSFILTGVPLVAAGYLMQRFLIPKEPFSITVQEGMVVVSAVWFLSALFGTVPFMIIMDMTFTQSMFESISAWTTTGLSVVDLEAAPIIILFYRSFLQLVGGAGFAIIALSAVTAPTGAGLSVAEGRTEQLAPHVRRSAAIVMRMYLGYIAFGIVALYLAGMSLFDAVNHAFAAVPAGGFSTHPESIGYWDSAAIEAVIIVLMILGSTNFLTAYTLFQRKYNAVIHNGELRLVAVVLPLSILALFLVVTSSVYLSTEKAVRVAVFEVTSALTTTGFAVSNYHLLGGFGWILLTMLMIVGGGSGSTAGGIKQYRIYALFKSLKWELRRAFLPQHSVNEPSMWQGAHRGFLSDTQLRQITTMIFVYVVFYFLGAGILAAHGYSVGESMFEFASVLSTAGLSVGITAADAPEPVLWTQIIGMYLGRLEFLAIIIGIMKLFSDIRQMRPRRQPSLQSKPVNAAPSSSQVAARMRKTQTNELRRVQPDESQPPSTPSS